MDGQVTEAKPASGAGEDKRLEKFIADPKLLATFWTAQAAWAFVVSLPVTLSNYAAAARASEYVTKGITHRFVGGRSYAAACILAWSACFALETAADYQKFVFKLNPENKGRFDSEGVWSWSRHPNYAGEIGMWVALAALATPLLMATRGKGVGISSRLAQTACAWLSPLFTAYLLTQVSGVPLLENKYDRIYENDAEYQLYKSVTPILFPNLKLRQP